MLKLEFGSPGASSSGSRFSLDDPIELSVDAHDSAPCLYGSMPSQQGTSSQQGLYGISPPAKPTALAAGLTNPGRPMSRAVFDPITQLLMQNPVMLGEVHPTEMHSVVSYDRSTIAALRAAKLTNDPIQARRLDAPLVRNLGLIETMDQLRARGVFAHCETDPDGEVARLRLQDFVQAVTSDDPTQRDRARAQVQPHQRMTANSQQQLLLERQAADIVQGIERGDIQGVPRAETVGLSSAINLIALTTLLEWEDDGRQAWLAKLVQNIRTRYAEYLRIPPQRPAGLSYYLGDTFSGSPPPGTVLRFCRPQWPQADNLPALPGRVLTLLESVFTLPPALTFGARGKLASWQQELDFLPVSGQLLYQFWVAHSELQHTLQSRGSGNPLDSMCETSCTANSLRDQDRNPYASLGQDDDLG